MARGKEGVARGREAWLEKVLGSIMKNRAWERGGEEGEEGEEERREG